MQKVKANAEEIALTIAQTYDADATVSIWKNKLYVKYPGAPRAFQNGGDVSLITKYANTPTAGRTGNQKAMNKVITDIAAAIFEN